MAGGLDALLLFNNRKNTWLIKEKRGKALKNSFENESKTRGIENIFPMQLPMDKVKLYDEMLGSIQIGNYPTFMNFAAYDSVSNMFFLFRAYTFAKEAQLLSLYNKPESKNYGSTNLFSAITNCSKTSVERVLGELSKGGKKHAKIFHNYGKQQETDPSIGGAIFYNLTSNADEYISEFEIRLEKIDSDFKSLLDNYKEYIGGIVNNFWRERIIFKKPIMGDQKLFDVKGPMMHNYYHTRGEKNLEKALAIHEKNYQDALLKI